MAEKVTVDLTTGIGTISFPRLFVQTAGKKDDGSASYDVQFIIPKSQREDVKALLIAIQKVGKAQFGDNWKKFRQPLRDGDKEKDDLAEDGTTKGEKYPERLGCFFINARSTRPVGVVDRQRVPITEPSDIYGGCKAKINISFYPYNKSGNTGIGVSLNGVQKIADGDSFGGTRPSVESMFELLDEDEDLGLDDEIEIEEEEEVEETPAKKAPAKKAAAKKAPAKKAAAKKPVEVEVELDEEEEEEEDDLFEDLDDLD